MICDPDSIIDLNVGGVYYSTSLDTLRKEPNSYLAKIFSDRTKQSSIRDTKGKYFIDRDGVLFRYILDYLRNLKLVLPENFHEKDRLQQEAEFYNLPDLVKILNNFSTHRSSHHSAFAENSTNASSSSAPSPVGDRGPGFITVGYRGTFAFGRDGLADVKFRKLSRIIVCGKVSLCREVFKDSLNESRDPDRGENDRYTSRFFLKHSFLEQAFDNLQEEGFTLVGSCGSGTNSAGELKPGMDSEEAKWQHYNEFIFERH
ncbi:unnamed protein product [Candidula unifasciata]|uniref:BTB domain-containing protein n=1 Tax=Candidula unifasciata TaxID=100452 RepID=A0A8S3YPR5_9EUPU|nr:unnamed protein product [Candidula unifasciata]